MTREEAIHKMEYSKRAYQMLIDEKVQEGVLVGHGINAEWSADTPIIDAYKDMLEACDMAIKALKQKPCKNAIDRDEAIRVASGYCHFSNVQKELAKLPPVTVESCDDVTTFKEAVLDAISRIGLQKSDTKEVQAVAECLRAVEALPP